MNNKFTVNFNKKKKETFKNISLKLNSNFRDNSKYNVNIIKNQITFKKRKLIENSKYNVIKQLLQCMIKKGHKATIEKEFKKMLFFMAQNKKLCKYNLRLTIYKGLKNITPMMDIRIIKFKRRTFEKIRFLSTKRQSIIMAHWLVKDINNKSNNFYKKLAFELSDASLKQGLIVKKNA